MNGEGGSEDDESWKEKALAMQGKAKSRGKRLRAHKKTAAALHEACLLEEARKSMEREQVRSELRLVELETAALRASVAEQRAELLRRDGKFSA